MKSFDIKPKKKNEKPGIPERSLAKLPAPPRIPKKKLGRKIIIGGSVAMMLIVISLVFLVLPEARIQVKAREEPVTRDLDIEVSMDFQEASATQLHVPGRLLEKESVAERTFPATGSKNVGKKASGFVYIYNFSKSNLILKQNTTVLIANGRKYFFTQDAGNIRPTAFIGLEDQEIDPTSLAPPIPVVAEGPGSAYNFPSGARLEVDNEAFGSDPEILYAVVAEDVSGGTDEHISVVSQSDISSASTAVEKEVIENVRKELLAENPDLKILDNAVAIEVIEKNTSVPAGAETREFTASVKAKLRALIYDESDVMKVVTERVKRLIPENKELKEGGNVFLRSEFRSLSLEEGRGILSTHFESQVRYKVDQEEFLSKIKGKNLVEISEVLGSRQEIERAEVEFYPFWVKKAPKFINKIHVEILP